jgi:alanine dehydrogenase
MPDSAISDQDYVAQGAQVVADADALFGEADLVVKVKEPQPVEIARIEARHTLFTYLHLAPDPEQTKGLLDSGAICIAYETVTDRFGGLPLLAPMSEVAGRMSIQAGAHSLSALARPGKDPQAEKAALAGNVCGANLGIGFVQQA